MAAARSLPLAIPKIAGQRWSCHSCGDCCRLLVVHLSEKDRRRIDRQGWADKLGVAPYVSIGREVVLNKRADGTCVFLDESRRCTIHTEYGGQAKPFDCRVFPFSVRSCHGGWRAVPRFDCPSVARSQGKPIEQHRAWLGRLVNELQHDDGIDDDTADLGPGTRASVEELEGIARRFSRWLDNDKLAMRDRLIAAARVTATLAEASLKKVRGPRLGELLDLLLGEQASGSTSAPALPTVRQRGMLRQLAFAYAEHVTLDTLRCGYWGRLRARWRQLRSAKRFLKGRGVAPALPGVAASSAFDVIESVEGATTQTDDIDDLLRRYVNTRLKGRSFCGAGYYGWSVINGLCALWLSAAVAGWVARYVSAAAGRSSVRFEEAVRAIAVVDRAATRLPALGTLTERARIRYFLHDDGAARLLHAYALTVAHSPVA